MSLRRVPCFVRVRFLTEEEVATGESDGLATDPERRCVLVGQHNSYHFDAVFHAAATLQQICDTVVVGMVREALKGFQDALLLYGPTGGGKTYTLNQLLPVVIRLLLQVADLESLSYETSISVECVEVYLERVSDLLDSTKADLQLREFPDTGVYVRGATEVAIRSMEEFGRVWEKVKLSRSYADTHHNATSSRGHCVVTLGVKRRRRVKDGYALNSLQGERMENEENSPALATNGRIYLADLAGCERLKECGHEGGIRQAEETTTINQSLSALHSVMNALTDPKKTHVPFRDSKLTRLLQEPLGRGGSCYLLLCVSPSKKSLPETRLALAFGVRSMSIVQQAATRQIMDPTAHLVDLQHWLANRVHQLEGQLRHLTSSTSVECHACIEKEAQLLHFSGEVQRLETVLSHTTEEYNTSLSRLRDALEMAENDCQYYRQKMSKSTSTDEDIFQRKLRALNDYWLGYSATLQQELENAERERDNACAELRIISDELRILKTGSQNTYCDIEN